MIKLKQKEKEEIRELTKEEKKVIYMFIAVVAIGTLFPLFIIFKYLNAGAMSAEEAFLMGDQELMNYYIGSGIVWVICLIISLIIVFTSKPENRKIAEDYAMALFTSGLTLMCIYMSSNIIFTLLSMAKGL